MSKTNERLPLAWAAYNEADAILSIIGKIKDVDDLPALRGLTMRCRDLLGVMHAAADESFSAPDCMRETLYGCGAWPEEAGNHE